MVYNTMPVAVEGERREEEQTKKLRTILFQTSFALLFLVVFLFVYHDITKDTSSVYSSSSSSSSTSSSTKTTTKTSTKKEPKAASTENPNLVFIYIDDMGFGSIGRNQYDISGFSPFISSLLEEGLFFSNYYAQEECTPSRAALMTGRYPISTGMQYYLVQPANQFALNLTETLLPEVLRDYGGYSTYGIGKWHLGHYLPDYLPTARGFDEYLGYLTGEVCYWSKLMSTSSSYYHDIVYMNSTCYYPYANKTDSSSYSSTLFSEKAIDLIVTHDYSSNPMFLYLPFQNVHDPFSDIIGYTDGLNASFVDVHLYQRATNRLPGTTRQQYAMSLYMLDQSVKKLYNAVEKVGQLDNTLFVFAADNGGCYNAGGRNGDLRGNKGTLFEGGFKVDAFLYGPKILPESSKGCNYTNIFHVSDWFPTLMGLLNIDYTPENAYDGVDHSSFIRAWGSSNQADVHGLNGPRQSLVYNIYYNIDNKDYNETTAPFAVRNNRYKLVRTYIDNKYTSWYNFTESYPQDDDLDRGSCSQQLSAKGTWDTMLFDLWNDPYETTDLYETVSETNDASAYAAKVELEAMFEDLLSKIALNTYSGSADSDSLTYWANHWDYILPWGTGSSSLSLCPPTTTFTVIDELL
jgi:arylsulfatase A-like enzyme